MVDWKNADTTRKSPPSGPTFCLSLNAPDQRIAATPIFTQKAAQKIKNEN